MEVHITCSILLVLLLFPSVISCCCRFRQSSRAAAGSVSNLCLLIPGDSFPQTALGERRKLLESKRAQLLKFYRQDLFQR